MFSHDVCLRLFCWNVEQIVMQIVQLPTHEKDTTESSAQPAVSVENMLELPTPTQLNSQCATRD